MVKRSYADDMHRFTVSQTVEEQLYLSSMQSASLSHVLAPSLAQNVEKQIHSPWFGGRGCKQETKRAYHEKEYSGKVQFVVRDLGVQVHFAGEGEETQESDHVLYEFLS